MIDGLESTSKTITQEESTPIVVASEVTLDEENDTPTTGSGNTGTYTTAVNIVPHVHNEEEEDDAMYFSNSGEEIQNRFENAQQNRCLFHACICTYMAIDFNCHIVGCSRTSDCLCMRHNTCCAYGHKDYGFGITTNSFDEKNELCKLGCLCCECGLIVPTSLCTSTEQFCCVQSVASFPFHSDYVPEPVCAYYGISCLPRCGCCVAPPHSRAIQSLRSCNSQHRRRHYGNNHIEFHAIPSTTTTTYDNPMHRE